ncbi:hypothetical protein ACWOFR_17705 [Carnobacterium gallinarum]|uniref:hypothetical protein n=1 Tax=Carnobacterium gallinarum TaxID=2749 RepID=UPI00054EEBC7|nr:hypothetical protein [Carnobacterium gallinarum]
MIRKWQASILVVVVLISSMVAIYVQKIRKDSLLEAATIVVEGDFKLNISNVWDKIAEKPAVTLDWENIDNLTQKGYRMYQSEDSGSTWEVRSLNYGKQVKVLNVYPDIEESNTFKSWMDSLNLTTNDGDKLIDVIPVKYSDFNNNSLNYLQDDQGNWKYDVLMFGSWDYNNHRTLNEESAGYVMDFINDGRGALFGHDTLAGPWDLYEHNKYMRPFAEKLGVTFGWSETVSSGSEKIKLINNGYLMKYPFEMENDVELEIPASHSLEPQIKNVGEVWFELIDLSFFETTVFDDGINRGAWYLKTNENIAMIQTGHSDGQSTMEERKIIANTLYNLAQISIESYATDQSVQDNVAPEKAKLEKKNGTFYDFSVNVESIDLGKNYQWYVEADTKDTGLLKSDTMKETITSNVAGYFYRMDESESSNLAKEVEGFKDGYGRIPKDKYDLYVAPTDSTESDYSTASEIKGLNGDKDANKYIHVVSVDRSNNVSEVSSIKVSDLIEDGDFKLSAKNAWDKDAEKSYADLKWDEVQNLSQKGYQLFQSEDEGQNWVVKPLNYGKQVKVLNVYPDIEESNTFKSWMDSLNLTTNDGDKLIDVIPVKYSDFDNNSLNYLQDDQGNWKYDVLMFGSWDSNNGMTLNEESAGYVMDFINDGRGALFGHDTIVGYDPEDPYYKKNINMKPFAEKLGITYGFNNPATVIVSEKIKLINNGYLMKYPFEMENDVELEIPPSHPNEPQIKEVGDVWFEFISPTIYDDGTYRGGWYLRTNENIAMIQTGHSNGQSTMEERKIIANTLYNLAQISIDEGAKEQTVVDDVQSEAPKIEYNSGTFENFSLNLNSIDHGKPYQWYIEANTKNSGVLRSNIAKEEIKSNIAGYFYRIDSSETSDLSKEVESFKNSYGRIPKDKYDAYVAPHNSDAVAYETKTEVTGLNGAEDANKYIHVVAVDRANNVSDVSSMQISELMMEFQITETYQDEFNNSLKPDTKVLINKNENYVNAFPDIVPYSKYGYQIDQSDIIEIDNIESGNATISNVIKNYTMKYIYTKPINLHVRQVITSESGNIAVPEKGKVEVWTMKDESTNDILTKTNYDIKSGLGDIGFSNIEFDKTFGYNFLYLKPHEPSFYLYDGVVITKENIPHNSADKINAYPSLALSKGNEYWITIYLKSTITADVYLNVVNNRLNVYYSNIDHFTVYIDGEEYKDFTVTDKPTVESMVLDIPVSEIRNKVSVKYTSSDGEVMRAYWNNTWDFVD